MPEETPELGAPETQEVNKAPDTEVDPAAEIEKWKTLSRKHEERARENAKKAKEYDSYVESQKSESQKLVEAKEAAEKLAHSSAHELAIYKAAVKYKLDGEDLELLEGVPAEKVEEKAKHISERLNRGGKNFPNLAQGLGVTSGKTNMNDLIRQAAGER